MVFSHVLFFLLTCIIFEPPYFHEMICLFVTVISVQTLGTGHGVGAALNVHEGPQSISFRFGNMTPLVKGMVVSNEPGYYEDHAFGIRIEVSSSVCGTILCHEYHCVDALLSLDFVLVKTMNIPSETFLLIFLPVLLQNLVYVKEVDTPNRFGGLEYLGFEKISFLPIQVFQL